MDAIKFLRTKEVCPDSPREGILSILEVLRADWSTADILISELSGGYLNNMYHVYTPGKTPKEGLVFRVYRDFSNVQEVTETTNKLLDRNKDFVGLQAAHKTKCGPPVLALFRNGIVVGFCPGKNPTLEEFDQPKVYNAIARSIARLHHIDLESAELVYIDGSPVKKNTLPRAMDFLQDLIAGLVETHPNPELDKRMKENLLPKDAMMEEYHSLTHFLRSLDIPEVFTHHDIHIKNILYDPDADMAYLVDYDFCAYHYIFQDISRICSIRPYMGRLRFSSEESSAKPVPDQVLHNYLKTYLQTKFELEGKSPDDVQEDDITQLKYLTEIGCLVEDFFQVMAGVYMSLNAAIDKEGVTLDGIGISVFAKERYFAQKESALEAGKKYKELKLKKIKETM